METAPRRYGNCMVDLSLFSLKIHVASIHAWVAGKTSQITSVLRNQTSRIFCVSIYVQVDAHVQCMGMYGADVRCLP